MSQSTGGNQSAFDGAGGGGDQASCQKQQRQQASDQQQQLQPQPTANSSGALAAAPQPSRSSSHGVSSQASSSLTTPTGPPKRQSSIPIPNALVSSVNANKQRQPMCNECEKSLPNQIVFDKIESIIRKMQDEQTGLPVKTAKSFMTKIPSVFTGTDLIQWMMKNLKLEDQQEAIHLANLIASHGYIFPIEDHTLSIKNDCTFYRFQTPYLWPSNNIDPENTDYAVYLCKRTMQGKTRLELADYEAENLARLQKMFSRKWEFIFMQAESQAKVDKKRDKLERKVLDSQERAFWDVYRPVPGCVNTTELDIKKACRLSKSAKRCSECQKVVSGSGGGSSGVGGGGLLGGPQNQHQLQQSPLSQQVSSSLGQPQAPSPSPEVAQMKADYQVHRLSFKESTTTTVAPSSSTAASAAGLAKTPNSSQQQQPTSDHHHLHHHHHQQRQQKEPDQQQQQTCATVPEGQAAADLKAIRGEAAGGAELAAAEPAEPESTRPGPRQKRAPAEQEASNPKDKGSEQLQQQKEQLEKNQKVSGPDGGQQQEEQQQQAGESQKQQRNKQTAHSLHHHHHHHHQHSHPNHPHPHPHHHHHHHHHHHPHSHAHHAHHHAHHHHHNRQCPHHHKQQHAAKLQAATSSSSDLTGGQQQQQASAAAASTGSDNLRVQGSAGGSEPGPANQPTRCHSGRCSLRSKQRSSGSVDQLMGPPGTGHSRRKSECNRMMSMTESANTTSTSATKTSSANAQAGASEKATEREEAETRQRADDELRPRGEQANPRPASACCSLTSMNSGNNNTTNTTNTSANLEDQLRAERDRRRSQAMTTTPSATVATDNQKTAPTAVGNTQTQSGASVCAAKSFVAGSAAGPNLKRKSSLNLVARPPSADPTTATLTAPSARDSAADPLAARKGSVASAYGQHQRAQLKGAQSICGSPSAELQLASAGGTIASGGGGGAPTLNRVGSTIERGARLDAAGAHAGPSGIGGGALTSSSSHSTTAATTPANNATTTSNNNNMNELERELESLRLRLDRGGVKMSKVTQSYLSYFNQWAEYDPFIAQPLPSNPWQSDSTELWDSERQTKDVHCRRVRRWAFSLKELLNDPAGREQFHRFLEKEFSAENLKFWDAVQELKRVHARDVARRVEAIWTEYLAQDANCPINIDSKSYETSKKNMAKNKNNRYIFDEAAGHVYQLMKNDSYPRYLRSDMYKDYKEASERRRPNQVAFDVFKPQITTLKHKFNF